MLSAAERLTLAAALERLIPGDEHGPGATEANVLRFVERICEAHRDVYADGLARLASFTSRTVAEQDAELTRLERIGSPFFELVRLHAIQGMFGDPAHGGNAGFAGWDLLGFPGLKVRFSADDQALDVDVPRAR